MRLLDTLSAVPIDQVGLLVATPPVLGGGSDISPQEVGRVTSEYELILTKLFLQARRVLTTKGVLVVEPLPTISAKGIAVCTSFHTIRAAQECGLYVQGVWFRPYDMHRRITFCRTADGIDPDYNYSVTTIWNEDYWMVTQVELLLGKRFHGYADQQQRSNGSTGSSNSNEGTVGSENIPDRPKVLH